MTDFTQYMRTVCRHAKQAAHKTAQATTQQKNDALRAIASGLVSQKNSILAANDVDIQNGKDNNLSAPLLDRLAIGGKAFDTMVDGVLQIAALKDPIGEIEQQAYLPSGIRVGKQRVPLGVIGIIYESRPNVTVDAAALCLKAGNSVILRGGSEAIHTNTAIGQVIESALKHARFPEHAVHVLQYTDRALVGKLLSHTEMIDLIIPRGGKGLIRHVCEVSHIPILKHLDGNCHVYVDKSADMTKALAIAVNAKCRRYGVCNAMETLLVHKDVAEIFLPMFGRVMKENSVEIRGCDVTCRLLDCNAASEDDWKTEFHAPIVAVRVIVDLQEAISHINTFGSHHTDAIVGQDITRCDTFVRDVDSSSVIVNASTAFADGYEYGLGAEIGISTDKLHARGPVGVYGLTTQKYVVFGDGHIRD